MMLGNRLARKEQKEKRALERDQAKRRERYLSRHLSVAPRVGTRAGDDHRVRDGRIRGGVAHP